LNFWNQIELKFGAGMFLLNFMAGFCWFRLVPSFSMYPRIQ